jgi:hypothetical protein
MHSHRVISAGAIVFFVLGTSLLGCSDDPSPYVAGATSLPRHERAPATSAAEPPAASSEVDVCADPPALATDAAAALTIRSEPPPPLGGEIAPGVYDLVEIDTYAGDGEPSAKVRLDEHVDEGGAEDEPSSHASSLRSTVSIGDGYLVETRAEGHGPAETWGARLSVDGVELVLDRLCPTSGTAQRAPFTAAGEAGFAWTIDGRRFVYTRRP